MLQPANLPRQRDWYITDNDTAKQLWMSQDIPNVDGEISTITAMVPGVRRLAATPSWLVHRTHLPIMNSPEAFKIVSETKRYDWEARDRITNSRGFRLRVTQQQALDYMEPRRGILLGDSMRLGKTLSAAMAHDPDRGPLVVVAPLSTRGVWVGWLSRVFPETPIAVLIGKKIDKDLLKRSIIFVHYDIVRHWQVSMPIGTLVLDEAHALTNKDSLRSKAIAFLASRAEKVIAATGTPIWDRPKDLWNLIGILNPGAWGSYYDFGRRYGNPVETAWGVDFPGISNSDELKARLSEVMIRRLWKDVSEDLPPISRNIVVAEIDDKTRRKLDVVAASLKGERTNTAGHLATYRKILGQIKLKTTVAEVKKLQATGEPIVVWTWHKELASLIQFELGGDNIWLIDGDVNADKREQRIGEWKLCPNGVLIATMAVAQVGIDLSHSHLPIFAELDWTPAIVAQTEMRTYDPAKPMNITYVVADHIVDQRIIRSLVSKLGSSDPLGLGAAIDAIDAIRQAIYGPNEDPDMARFVDDILASDA